MKNKILSIFSWIFGILALSGGVLKLFSEPFIAIFLLTLGIMLFPPASHLIAKSKQARIIKILIGVAFFGSLVLGGYLQQQATPDKQLDRTKESNVKIIRQLTESYCNKNGKCPNSLEELYATGITGPFENYKAEDYFYRSVDNGKECLISTSLSTGKEYTVPCIGKNFRYLPHLLDPRGYVIR